MSQSAKKIIIFGIRIAIYSALMVLLNVLFMIDAGHETSTGKFGENSITEIMQELFLFLSGILFLFIGRTDRELKAISNLIALFFFMSFIREFNNQIDFWFWLVLPLFFLFGWLAIRDRNKLLPSTTMLMEIPAFAYLITGFLVTFVFSRFFGRTSFWMALLGEEGIELLGYTLFFIAAIEILWFVYNRKKSEPQ